MTLTPRQLNRATLARQLLLHRERLPVVEAVRRVVALQAQEPASPYVALWNRLAGFDPADLDAAFAEHTVVKATLLRLTLHAVSADDYPPFHAAMLPNLRAAGLADRRFTSTGLSVADADALVPHLLEFAAQPRTKVDIEALLVERLGDPHSPGLWRALKTYAPLLHVPTGGPWSFGGRASFRAAPTDPVPVDRDRALQRLIWRYLEGFGPASVQDSAQFTMQKRTVAREALEALGDRLTRIEGPDGRELFDVPDATLPHEDTPAPPRLLGMWDSVLLAHADRSRVIADAYRPLVTRRNGDVLPTLLIDGYVCGVWRPVADGIEALAFQPLSGDAWDGLAEEARGLGSLLAERDPTTYGRYGHWWSKLPSGDTRILPG